MLNYIPVFGWVLDLALKISLAIPFWFIWTAFGIGRKYFPFLPEIYQSIPFWDCVGLFMAIPILYTILIPKFVSVNNSQEVGMEDKKKKSSWD